VKPVVGAPAAFLDRDGVINVDSGHVHRVSDFHFMPDVINACRNLYSAGYKLIVVTNQAGIAHGYYDERAFEELSSWMSERFIEAGAPLADIYYCPHHPSGSVAKFTRVCSCRKPAPGMITRAVQEHRIDVLSSFLVGDKESDLEAAKRAGLRAGYLVTPAAGAENRSGSSGEFRSLAEVVRHVLGKSYRDTRALE
jgi:D-glycero-D-manno-heptose 1,7-bisphosphate phosphatase